MAMSPSEKTPRKPPKPKPPSKAKAKAKAKGAKGAKGTKGAKPRVTTAVLAERLEQVAGSVEAIAAALSPKERSEEVTAEENALLNLVDAIVDHRTERVLLPLAQLATLLDRLGSSDDAREQGELIQESATHIGVVLEALGLERISPNRGDEADPWFHEEVDFVTESDLEDGLIERVLRPGIRIRGGKTLIPALVSISSRSE